MSINGIEYAGKVILAVSGSTFPLASELRRRGYAWNSKRREWAREITTDTAAAMVADQCEASAPHLLTLDIEIRTERGNMLWGRSPRRAEAPKVGNCAACGSYGPLRITPHGWVCHDCH